jgi:hypothetical protein
MPNPVRPPRLSPALLAALAWLAAVPAARADKPQVGTILFKDGFSLEGYVVREKKTIVDPASGQPLTLQEGFFLVDDLARHVIFSPGQIQKVVPESSFNPDADALVSVRSIDYSFAKSLPPLRGVLEAGAWDDKWDRDYRFRTTEDRAVLARQHLAVLTPYYARLDSVPRIHNHSLTMPFRWNSYYRTPELGAEQVRTLLYLHPSLRQSSDVPADERAVRRLKVAQFLLSCGWPEEARAELERLARDLPDQKDRADAGLATLKRLHAARLARDLRVAYRAGQFKAVRQGLADFPEDGADERTLSDVRTLRAEAAEAGDHVEQARRLLKELTAALGEAGARAWLEPAAAAVAAEVAPDTVGRLESFLAQARQAERQRQAGKAPELGPPRLLALAVSGWLLGNTAAEDRIEVAERLWRTRQFVQQYQRIDDRMSRHRLLEEYERRGSSVTPLDELAQLIGMLPPPDPDPNPDRGPREVQVTGAGGRDVTYWLRLPPEYSPGRPYPLLLVLHEGGEAPKAALERWDEQASRYGYILAAPEWADGGQKEYLFSPREHRTVLDSVLDLRRRYAVDSDRVFLAGCGAGGNMAYDVGLAHPDLFAGVVPMSAFPGWWSDRYRPNAQYLPFYVIVGDRSGNSGDNRVMFQQWVPHGYPVLYVQYRGRGLEWFGGELPTVFDWMDRKKRSNPVSELGRLGGIAGGDEFVTRRSADNRFYWIGVDAIDPRQLNEGLPFNPRVLGATVQANRGGNHINVRTQGVRRLTVWFGQGDGVTDFDKPVSIIVNTVKRWDRKVTPGRETLLEDLVARGDRQRLYVARVELDAR